MDVLDRCSIVNCDAVIRTQLSWIRFTVSYSLFYNNQEIIIWVVIYLLSVVFFLIYQFPIVILNTSLRSVSYSDF